MFNTSFAECCFIFQIPPADIRSPLRQILFLRSRASLSSGPPQDFLHYNPFFESVKSFLWTGSGVTADRSADRSHLEKSAHFKEKKAAAPADHHLIS